MKLSSLDIRKQEFNRVFRGYDAEEVLAFLQMVSNQWQEIVDEQRRFEDRLKEQELKLQHYEKVEEALEEALRTARESSRQTIEHAEKKAQHIIAEAEAQAKLIKRDAEEDNHKLKRETAKVGNRQREIVARLRAFLMSEMEMLAHFDGDDPTGFIKLLPAQHHQQKGRLEQTTGYKPSLLEQPEESAPSAEEPRSGLNESTPTSEPQPSDVPPNESNPELALDEVISEIQEGDGLAAPAHSTVSEVQPEAEAMQGADKREGGGWVVNSLVSPYASSEQGNAEYETESSPARTVSATDDELEKIRRILDDLE